MGVWPLGPYVSRKRLFSTVPGGTEQISTLSFGSGSLLTSNLSWATDGSLESTWEVGRYEVDGSEIWRSPVEGSGKFIYHYLQGLDYIPGGCLEFLNHQQYEDGGEWPGGRYPVTLEGFCFFLGWCSEHKRRWLCMYAYKYTHIDIIVYGYMIHVYFFYKT